MYESEHRVLIAKIETELEFQVDSLPGVYMGYEGKALRGGSSDLVM